MEADSPHGYDPAAKAAFHCLGLYELSTALWMGNADMVLNIPHGIHVSRRRNSTREAAEWRAMHPMPSIMPELKQAITRSAATTGSRHAPNRTVGSCSGTTDASVLASSCREGVHDNEASDRTTILCDPSPRGQLDIPSITAFDPAPDLTSAFINRFEKNVAEIETSVLGCNGVNSVCHMSTQVDSCARSRTSMRPSLSVVSGSESYI